MGPSDEIAKIEKEGIEKTRVRDWAGARVLFEEALTFEMPALRRAEILRNVAGTCLEEGNRFGVQETSRRAIEVLDTVFEFREGHSACVQRQSMLQSDRQFPSQGYFCSRADLGP